MVRGAQSNSKVWLSILSLVVAVGLGSAAQAQETGGLAHVSGPIGVHASWRSFSVILPLSQPVPWRTRLLAAPPRAVVDFHTVDWTGVDIASVPLEGSAQALRVGQAGGGWSRLVIELSRPMGFAQAGLTTDPETGAAVLSLTLEPVSETAFAAQALALASVDVSENPNALALTMDRPPLGQRPTLIALDPGHGGVDPGASHDGIDEADVMLMFSRELATALRRTGRFEVVMTRDSNVFVSLDARITVAQLAGADLLLSLHADAIEDGLARGATVYTLAEDASDEASALLAERHDRDDLLGRGVNMAGADDAIASVLMSLARTETAPATNRLARALVASIQDAGLHMHRHPWQQGAFSVLKSATIPSALLEIGFLSDDRDLGRLRDPAWRARMAQAIIGGLDAWVAEEAVQSALRRR